MIRAARHVLMLVLAAALAVLPAPAPQAAPAAPAREAGAAAVLLFISSSTTADLAVPVAEVRSLVTEKLHRELAPPGRAMVASVALDEAVGRWRVRGDWALSAEFLAGLHRELDVEVLQVAHLHADAAGLSLIVRTVACPSGRLLAVQMPQVALSLDRNREGTLAAAPWLEALDRLCSLVDPTDPGAPPATPLVVIPAQGIGCEDHQTLTATASLLRLLLAQNRWELPDPALAATLLGREGVATTRIGARGRRLLTEEFGAGQMLLLTLAAYGESTPRGTADALDDGPSRAAVTALGDFDLALRRIDLTRGEVTGSTSIFAPATLREGWFGVIRNRSMQDRIQNAAGTLWQAFSTVPEDN